MTAKMVAEIKKPDGRRYNVKWDHIKKDVYISWGGWKYLGKSASAEDAKRIAEKFMEDK